MRSFAAITFALVFAIGTMPLYAAGPTYSWEKPLVFHAGKEVRYIGYENGDDENNGLTMATPWKHHPWDADATGKAAATSGPITYVFKGGVAYRGQLNADESGRPGEPIRLTRDPSWGEGRPWFIGSARLPAHWVKANRGRTPARLPQPEKVWALELKGTGLLDEKNDVVFRQPARTWTRRVNPPF